MIKSITVKFDKQYAPKIKFIRDHVFTIEQHVEPGINFDGLDLEATHVLVKLNKEYVSTGRILADGHIGRLAVLKEYRGRGLGQEALMALIGEAKKLNLNSVYLGAQQQAVGFYIKLGFSTYGEPYIEANIEHRFMKKSIA